ncbi:MAG: hypothetical protein MJZ64_02195 [Paludibacteraceae bacterium]|nr:hypothetical protein [Paludibacteraceae bacterium]
MKRLLLCLFCGLIGGWHVISATVYSRVGAKPATGWPGKYLIVYQPSETEAYVWNGEDANNNYVKATVSNGKITADNLGDYVVIVNAESTNEYGIKTGNGFIRTEAKQNSLLTDGKGAQSCYLAMNSGYTDITTNNGTQMLVYNTSNKRFRFYYDNTKKFTGYQHLYLYVEGDQEVVDGSNKLDINYAQADFYACQSKFSPADAQYYYVELSLLQEEDWDAVPQVGLTILAPSQYSIAGTYKSSHYYQDGKAYYIHETGGSAYSYIIFPSKEGGTTGSITDCVMTITKVGPSSLPNAYIYHIKLNLTDSNRKLWSLDKDLDVYAWWMDCDRSGKELVDEEPVAFAMESGNHNPTTAWREIIKTGTWQEGKSYLINNQLLIYCRGLWYDILGKQVHK